MAHLIDKDALVTKVDNLKHKVGDDYTYGHGWNDALRVLEAELDTLEVKEMDLHNNGWIDCAKQMPPETKQTSDTLQGHREWTESDRVLVWDSMYGCSVDVTKNGQWLSEQRGGYKGQAVHGIIAWKPIPEFIA